MNMNNYYWMVILMLHHKTLLIGLVHTNFGSI